MINLADIQRLKQQFRQGANPPPSPDDTGFFESLGKAAGGVSDAIESLYSKQGLLIQGTGRLINITQTLTNEYVKNAQQLLWLEKRNTELQKTFGLTVKQAGNYGAVLDSLSKDFKKGGTALREYAKNLKTVIGNYQLKDDSFSKNLLRTQEIITDSLQLSAEQANNFEFFARGANSSGAEYLMTTNGIAKELETITGESGLFKEITADVADLSADLQIQYSRIPGTLEVATVKAKKLGLSIEKLNAAGKNLLNIESSIGQELEYQLLSGRRLINQQGKSITNEYRVATIQGDASKQANLMNQILETEGETLKNNLFARQQMSQLLGMDEAALSRALQKKSILEELPGGDALFEETGKELFDAAKAMGATEDQLKALAESEDTRETNDILKDIDDKIISLGVARGIGTEQGNVVGDTSKTVIDAATGLSSLINLISPGLATTAGVIEKTNKTVNTVTDLATDFVGAWESGGWAGIIKTAGEKMSWMAGSSNQPLAIGSAQIAASTVNISNDIEEKAKGGPVAASTPYVVGEVGPELFVPNTAGNIIPNDKISISPAAAAGTEPTLAGSAGTDPTALANAIVAAFQSGVKLEVKIDPTFTGGGMNQGRYSS
jgi:hypothetical protein